MSTNKVSSLLEKFKKTDARNKSPSETGSSKNSKNLSSKSHEKEKSMTLPRRSQAPTVTGNTNSPKMNQKLVLTSQKAPSLRHSQSAMHINTNRLTPSSPKSPRVIHKTPEPVELNDINHVRRQVKSSSSFKNYQLVQTSVAQHVPKKSRPRAMSMLDLTTPYAPSKAKNSSAASLHFSSAASSAQNSPVFYEPKNGYARTPQTPASEYAEPISNYTRPTSMSGGHSHTPEPGSFSKTKNFTRSNSCLNEDDLKKRQKAARAAQAALTGYRNKEIKHNTGDVKVQRKIISNSVKKQDSYDSGSGTSPPVDKKKFTVDKLKKRSQTEQIHPPIRKSISPDDNPSMQRKIKILFILTEIEYQKNIFFLSELFN